MATPPAAGSRLLTSHPNRPRRAPPLSIVFVTREGAILARHASDLKGSGGLRRKKKGGEGCISDSVVSCIRPIDEPHVVSQPTYLLGLSVFFQRICLPFFLSFFLALLTPFLLKFKLKLSLKKKHILKIHRFVYQANPTGPSLSRCYHRYMEVRYAGGRTMNKLSEFPGFGSSLSLLLCRPIVSLQWSPFVHTPAIQPGGRRGEWKKSDMDFPFFHAESYYIGYKAVITLHEHPSLPPPPGCILIA